MTDQLMTAEQVAQMLSVPVGWVYAQSREGSLPTVELGRYRRFRREAIEEWITEQETNNNPRRTA